MKRFIATVLTCVGIVLGFESTARAGGINIEGVFCNSRESANIIADHLRRAEIGHAQVFIALLQGLFSREIEGLRDAYRSMPFEVDDEAIDTYFVFAPLWCAYGTESIVGWPEGAPRSGRIEVRQVMTAHSVTLNGTRKRIIASRYYVQESAILGY